MDILHFTPVAGSSHLRMCPAVYLRKQHATRNPSVLRNCVALLNPLCEF